MRSRGRATAPALAAAVMMLANCTAPTGATTPTESVGTTERSPTMTITVESTAFAAGDPIPRRFTGDGEDVSPPLRWSGLPEGTRELALIVDDPDAPRAEPWVHWLIYKIPATEQGLAEGVGAAAGPPLPSGTLEGRNDFGATGYGGPAPPRGHGTHHYHFRVYALDAPLEVGAGLEKPALLRAMEGHVLAQGDLVGTYRR